MKASAAEGTPEEQQRLAGRGDRNGELVAADGKAAEARWAPAPEEARGVFHSTRLFMLVFLSGWVMQGMFFTYFVGVITTLEKLFRIESTTTGTLLAATEIGQICTALLLTYVAGRGHRPRWIASMMLVLAAGVLGCVLPHLVYGTRLLDVHLDAHAASAPPRCDNSSLGASAAASRDSCARQQEHSDIRAVVMPWLFTCLLVVGVGQTGIATLGIPYVDDNVNSRQSPLYMAITIGIRVIGPALGFLLGALCTRVYVAPLAAPAFGPADPRWVGAWWLGMVLVAGFIVVLSLLMFCFPRQIRASPAAAATPPALPDPDKKSPVIFQDFAKTIKRQLTNDILMCRTASSVLHLVPISGLYSFLPKYLETQFRLPPYEANLASGLGGILVMGLGIITAGLVILRLVPTARQVAAWTAATALFYTAGMMVLMVVSCPEEVLAPLGVAGGAGAPGLAAGAGVLAPSCGAPCHCSSNQFSTVCGQDGVTYLSGCHAGCAAVRGGDGGALLYYQCRCVNSTTAPDSPLAPAPHPGLAALPERERGAGGWAVEGACGSSCWQLYAFVALFALVMFTHASGEVGSVLLIIRCTDPGDKAMAMGVIQFAIGVFGNVPCPVVFGAVVDAACHAKDALCGVLGACATYDNYKFRHYFLGLSGGIMFLGFIMDVLVWHKASRIDINPERDDLPAPASSAAPAAPLLPDTSV